MREYRTPGYLAGAAGNRRPYATWVMAGQEKKMRAGKKILKSQ